MRTRKNTIAHVEAQAQIQTRKIVLVGGVGRMYEAYRLAVKATGRELVHCEKGLPPPVQGVDAVMVVVPVCSHPQREGAATLAARLGTRVVYLRTAGVATLTRALSALGGVRAASSILQGSAHG